MDFNKDDAHVAADICRILKGPGRSSADPPRKAMLSSGDIFSQAGPCPLSFLSNPRTDFAGRAANVTELDSMVEEEEADPEQEGEEDFDEDTRQDLEENEDVESENDFAGGAFATRKVGARRKIRGGLDIERDAQLIMLFMQQCRLK